jgi:Restriction endonuclease BglII
MFENLREKGFQIEFVSHAEAILRFDFPDVARDLDSVLANVSIPIEEIIRSGGGETKATQRLRRAFVEKGWSKHKFEIVRTIDGVRREAISHEIDHMAKYDRGVIALEIEWNNKDPFFDRDLENFKRLHADGAISLGVIVTRGSTLQDGLRDMVTRYAVEAKIESDADLSGIGLSPTRRQIAAYSRRGRGERTFATGWAAAFTQDKFGASTTHWRKLEDRVRRGVGNPCPLLLIGLPASIVTFEKAPDPTTEETPIDGASIDD